VESQTAATHRPANPASPRTTRQLPL
jgi:hypothetical protein